MNELNKNTINKNDFIVTKCDLLLKKILAPFFNSSLIVLEICIKKKLELIYYKISILTILETAKPLV